MLPRTLSASGALVFEHCERRYLEEYVNKASDLSSDAADKGTVCHAVLERWVVEGHYQATPKPKFSKMEALLVQEYWKLFGDTDAYDECRQMLEDWYNRQEWHLVDVVSAEDKKFFPVPVEGVTWDDHPDPHPDAQPGMIPFTYIRDRLDIRKADGIPSVVDYKSISKPINSDQLQRKVQARVYGLATQIEYKDAPGIWVVFDLLRYNTVGVYFDRAANTETWVYVKELARRIFESDGSKETLNPECRYCVRRTVCDTLKRHEAAGGPLNLPIDELIDRAAEVKWAMDGLRSGYDTMSQIILDHMEEEAAAEAFGTTTEVKIKRKRIRKADPVMVERIVGKEVMDRWKKYPGIGDIDKMLKNEPGLTDTQKAQVKQLIEKVSGAAWLDFQPLTQFEED